MGAEPASQRQHYWDVTRAFLMLLGLPYHVAMLYHPGGWIVAVDRESPLLGAIAAFIHLFRMPAFFVVAGYFAALLLARREAGTWVRSRFFRLGVPLITSLIVLVPVLNMLGELSGRAPHAAFAEWKYQTATSGGYWVRHLWFLIVLLYLSALSAGAVALFPSLAGWQLADRRDGALARWLPLAMLGIAAVIGLVEAGGIELFYRAGLNTNLVQQILRLDDLIMAAPFFLFGAFLQRSPRLLDAFGKPSLPMLAGAIVSVVAGILYAEQAWPPLGRFIGGVAAVAMTQVVVSGARALFDRPSRAVQRLVAGSFVIYLFHLPILIGLYDLAKRADLAPAIGFPVILLLTFGLSWAVWRVVERSPALNLLFNGIAPSGAQPTQTGKAAKRPVPLSS
ncbi:acyltransferase family protein [Sphingomonas sp. BIUV-7]|uniref:Acyltransferase family protein n=1 Tax=Sphingomonas natans TaxID=3063330 RepID=A0ABT8YAJ5_9SPHN|nr:acyltransferase family protein [Sphingomonas sp. BIUV-7]MDO6414675.1 acyltransferase family protein [Sphingomonas sp. BIUV-7]